MTYQAIVVGDYPAHHSDVVGHDIHPDAVRPYFEQFELSAFTGA
jgi:hypothetical protein